MSQDFPVDYPPKRGFALGTTFAGKKASNNHRNAGNSMYREGKFFQALEFYNKSLMATFPHSPEISLAFANRGAVYLELKEYKLCLDNIQLARDSGYPAEKLQTLKDREDKCKMLMKTESCFNNDPWEFFKLSYPANPKIPFIANCVELRKDKKFGRGVYTNRGTLLILLLFTSITIFLTLSLRFAAWRRDRSRRTIL
jgi:tetratricopeptide (TPR) repeat protein